MQTPVLATVASYDTDRFFRRAPCPPQKRGTRFGYVTRRFADGRTVFLGRAGICRRQVPRFGQRFQRNALQGRDRSDPDLPPKYGPGAILVNQSL